MPKITIKYNHPHELTELFGKLAQVYVLPQSICNVDTPYPQPTNFNNTIDEISNELAQGYRDRIADLINQNCELREVGEAKLKGAEQRELTVLEKYHVVCDELNQLRYAEKELTKKLDEYRETLKQIHNLIIERGLLSDVSFDDGIKHFPLLISCIIRDNREMRNSLRELGVHVYTKDNSAFIADSDNQLFTLEEAAEYLEVGINEMPLVMANYFPNMDKLTTKEFLLSDLRWIKANLKLS